MLDLREPPAESMGRDQRAGCDVTGGASGFALDDGRLPMPRLRILGLCVGAGKQADKLSSV